MVEICVEADGMQLLIRNNHTWMIRMMRDYNPYHYIIIASIVSAIANALPKLLKLITQVCCKLCNQIFT
jgi:hypothetical protein